MPKLISPAFSLQVFGWIPDKKFAWSPTFCFLGKKIFAFLHTLRSSRKRVLREEGHFEKLREVHMGHLVASGHVGFLREISPTSWMPSNCYAP